MEKSEITKVEHILVEGEPKLKPLTPAFELVSEHTMRIAAMKWWSNPNRTEET